MININLFGGPSLGKSTTAAGLFYEMKKESYNVEFVQEYAKDLVYGREFTRLSDQLHILGEQHHKIHRLENNVDFLIHDSPFPLGLVYIQDSEHLPVDTFEKLVIQMFQSYNNINIFLERNPDFSFKDGEGRIQNEEQSKEKDKKIKELLDKHHIMYHTLQVNEDIVNDILFLIKNTQPNFFRNR